MRKKTLLLLSGLDPTGGAGLQADIQVAIAHDVHSLPCMTINTVQDSSEVKRFSAVDPAFLDHQLQTLRRDIPIDGIKIGAVGTPALLEPIGRLVRALWVPVVVDPVLAGGGGGFLSTDDYAELLFQDVLPATTLLTPNHDELKRLTGEEDIPKALDKVLSTGTRYVLLTGGDPVGGAVNDRVINQLYARNKGHPSRVELLGETRAPRLTGQFHGTGCTLSTAMACLLVRGVPILEAMQRAEAFVHRSLKEGYPLGHGQYFLARHQSAAKEVQQNAP